MAQLFRQPWIPQRPPFLTALVLLVSIQLLAGLANAQSTSRDEGLVKLLVSKGVITLDEANNLNAAPASDKRDRLIALLAQKGILSSSDVASISGVPAAAPVILKPVTATAQPPSASQPLLGSQAPAPIAASPRVPAVVAAVAPVRVLPLDPPVKGGLVPAFRIGPVSVTPYGFIKATAAHDSSMPNGDDFPFPGLFLTSTSVLNTGPTPDPEFHLKSRQSRIGLNFEWPDISKKITLTGRLEGDFEGNFSEVDNRDISSVRSNAFQVRLAYTRMDFSPTDKTDIFFEGGQDWAIFGTSALPNLLETTFLGAFWGDVYQRAPQMRFGVVRDLGGPLHFKISPEVAIMLPGSGEIEKLGSSITCPPVTPPATVASCTFVNGLQNQLGQGERQGADSARPELEARTVLQFQLDKAPGVPSAELIVAGFQSKRKSIVTSDAYPTNAALGAPLPANYLAAFPNGFTASSDQWGGQIAAQLPTRWATLTVSAYRGADMRFFFGGQIDSYFTDTAGLSNPRTVFQSVDNVAGVASGPMVLGTNASGQVVVAHQRPVRTFGGFVNLGLPVSRWFGANPKGHNAGWQIYLHAGKDQVVHRDALRSGLPLYMGSMAAATLYYKFNPWVTFGLEQSMYADHIIPEFGSLYTIGGAPARTWIDHRTEFGPIFTF